MLGEDFSSLFDLNEDMASKLLVRLDTATAADAGALEVLALYTYLYRCAYDERDK